MIILADLSELLEMIVRRSRVEALRTFRIKSGGPSELHLLQVPLAERCNPFVARQCPAQLLDPVLQLPAAPRVSLECLLLHPVN